MAQRIIGRPVVQEPGVANLQREVGQAFRPLKLATLVFLGGMAPVVALFLRGVPADTLTRDIFIYTGLNVYVGLLSNIGIVIWGATAAVWLLCAAMLGRVARSHSLRPLALGAGIFTLWLLADDALMLHEHLLPQLTGLKEGYFLVAYGGSALALLLLGARKIMRTNYLLVLLAGGLLVASILCDKLLPRTELELLVEDGLKFAGIAVWAAYAVDTTLRVAERLFRRA